MLIEFIVHIFVTCLLVLAWLSLAGFAIETTENVLKYLGIPVVGNYEIYTIAGVFNLFFPFIGLPLSLVILITIGSYKHLKEEKKKLMEV